MEYSIIETVEDMLFANYTVIHEGKSVSCPFPPHSSHRDLPVWLHP